MVPALMSTTSPAWGTRSSDQVAGLDQLPLWTLTMVGFAPKSGMLR